MDLYALMSVKPKAAGVVVVALFALSGCALLTPLTDEEQVSKLVLQRWEATLAGDHEKAYGFAAPSYRSVAELQRFKLKNSAASVVKDGVKVHSVKCEAAACIAMVSMQYYLPFGGSGKPGSIGNSAYEERWVKEDGRWWFYPR